MNSAIARQREINALFVAASCIAAIRTAQQNVEPTSWQLLDRIGDSLRLARMLRREIEGDESGTNDR